MRTHEIKCEIEYFAEVKAGKKTFEYRKNDRNYEVGDLVTMFEYDIIKNKYTGRFVSSIITYVLSDFEGLKENYCVFSSEIYGRYFKYSEDYMSFDDIKYMKDSSNIC